jgi:hypothetical protein
MPNSKEEFRMLSDFDQLDQLARDPGEICEWTDNAIEGKGQ